MAPGEERVLVVEMEEDEVDFNIKEQVERSRTVWKSGTFQLKLVVMLLLLGILLPLIFLPLIFP